MRFPVLLFFLALCSPAVSGQEKPATPPAPAAETPAAPKSHPWSKAALEVVAATNRKEFDKAFATAKKAAGEGDVDCVFLLGRLFENGYGTKVDAAAALRQYVMAAEKGHLEAKFNWARCLAEGIGGKVDNEKSDFLLQQAAEAGFGAAQSRMGRLELDAVRRPRNEVAAREWFEKAAAQNDPEALYRMALCHQNGWGGLAKDLKKALENLLKAANAGYVEAINLVGIYYQHGIELRQDKVAAAGWFRYAAEYGHPAALSNLGQCYEFGQGVKPDIATAVKYYQEAASKGDGAGHLNLGRCHDAGRGLPASPVLAYAHFFRSYELGTEAAAKLRDDAKARLTPQQLQEAEKTLTGWKAVKPAADNE
ncbi:MAG: sel1 repeat family protein [Verrucomicrobiales bacterium]|nr:sel1 repeat family protein [Verrucomicrobiales bacterium]